MVRFRVESAEACGFVTKITFPEQLFGSISAGSANEDIPALIGPLVHVPRPFASEKRTSTDFGSELYIPSSKLTLSKAFAFASTFSVPWGSIGSPDAEKAERVMDDLTYDLAVLEALRSAKDILEGTS